MKKINREFIIGKTGASAKHIKIFLLLMFIVLIALIAALVNFYMDVNKNSSTENPDIIVKLNENGYGYKIFKNDDGMLGVADKDETIIIQPQWTEIYFLNSNRFIVSKDINGTKFGIIDRDENVVVPFAFRKFKSLDNNILQGYPYSEEGCILFDTSGNILSNDLWSACSKNNNLIELSKDNCGCTAEFEDGKLVFKKVSAFNYINGIKFEFESFDSILVNNLKISDYINISDIVSSYFESMLSDDLNSLINITDSEYYTNIASVNPLKFCQLNKIKSCTIELDNNSNIPEYIIDINVNFDYINGDDSVYNKYAEFILRIIKNESGSFILKNAESDVTDS